MKRRRADDPGIDAAMKKNDVGFRLGLWILCDRKGTAHNKKMAAFMFIQLLPVERARSAECV